MTTDVLQYTDMTEAHIAEAVAQAGRYDRLLSNQHGDDAFPVSKRTVRLMSLVILKLKSDVEALKKKPVTPKQDLPQSRDTTKPPLRSHHASTLNAIETILQRGEVVTTRNVAELCGWASHNTAAKHINTLLDLGYITRVGKQGVIVINNKMK